MTRFMPRRCPSSQNMWEANCGPLSEMALLGDPYCLYSESRSRVAVPVVSVQSVFLMRSFSLVSIMFMNSESGSSVQSSLSSSVSGQGPSIVIMHRIAPSVYRGYG